jgi:peroxiredoxin
MIRRIKAYAAAVAMSLAVTAPIVFAQGSGSKGSMNQGSGNKMKASVKIAPDFTAGDHMGNTHSLSDYRGKVVVLEWLNPGCPFVKRHYREGTFKELAQQYGNRGVVWLAVNSTSSNDASDSEAWAEEHDLPYPILVDKTGKVGKKYNARTTPHMFVINPNGGLVYDGAVDNDPQGNKDNRMVYVKEAIEAALVGAVPEKQETKPYGCSVKYAD